MDNYSPTRLFRTGRQKGARNVISGVAKHNVQQVFDGLGGWNAMLEWAETHKDLFYGSVYPRLMASEGAESGGDITVILQRGPGSTQGALTNIPTLPDET